MVSVRARYLEDFLQDSTYGKTNRAIADEVGSGISKKELGVQLGTLNNLAKNAEISASKLLTEYRAMVESLKAKDVESPAVQALDALARNIAWRIAYEEQQKKEKKN